MVRNKTIGLIVLALTLSSGLGGCAWLDKTFPDRAAQYKKAKPVQPLDVPPDLTTTPSADGLETATGSATLSGYTSARESQNKQGGEQNKVLPDAGAIKFERDHNEAWLVVPGDPAAVWARARQFWPENGFFITTESPELGILQTDWIDSRADIPKGPIRRVISRIYPNAYSSAYRDRYRMRLERGDTPDTTDIYITHQGVEEVVDSKQDQTTTWAPRPPDPGLESTMLKRMMMFLGVSPAQAKERVAQAAPHQDRAELVQQGTGQATLVVHEDFEKAWRGVGIVLDRVGFAVEDRDRLQGLYYVRYSDPLKRQEKGVLSKLAFWSKDKQAVDHYRIKLTDDGVDTRVVVQDKDGNPEKSVTGVRILKLLFDQLR